MKNMDKGLTVPKLVLIVWPKIPQMPQNLSAQLVCQSPKAQIKKGFIGLPWSVCMGDGVQGLRHTSPLEK